MPTRQASTERSQQLELIETLAEVGHWSLDTETGLFHWSDAVFRIHGFEGPVPPTLDTVFNCYAPADQVRLRAMVESAIERGEGYAFEGRLRRPDGDVRQVSVRARCRFDAEGRTIGIFGVVRDVTMQVRSAQMTEAMLSRLMVMAAHYTADLRCTFAHGSYLEVLGRTSEGSVGLHAREVMGEALFARNLPYLEGALRGETQSFERSLQTEDGKPLHVLAHYEPDITADGEVIGVFILVNDVTALSQARDEAKAGARAKSEFLANMSHELRTPLTSIIGFSELLAEASVLDAAGSHYVARIRDASTALLATINDILDVSKIDAGEVVLQAAPFDPEALARGVLELLQPQAEAKGVDRVCVIDGLPAQVIGDEDRIRQVLLNLVNNAVKFTACGSVALAARWADGRLRFEVTDTGVGIPADKIDRLFTRFGQLDTSTTRVVGGTGLGLAICRGLVTAMGGTLGVESEPGRGSLFWVELPCKAAAASAAAANPEGADSFWLEGLRLLLADDNAINRELVRTLCEPFGVNLIEAEGGAEAVAEADRTRFDLILLDIRMPDVDGPTAAMAIRARPGPNQRTPIVAFTADCSVGDPALAGLFDGVLAKPVTPRNFLRALAMVERGGVDAGVMTNAA